MTVADTNADIKLKILLAAKKLFAQYGFEKTTIRQICEEAGANIALVSYYFGGKENMFCALFENFFPNDELASVDAALEPVKGVELLIQQVTLFRYHDYELSRIIQQEIIMNTSRTQIISEHVMPMWKLLRHWLEQGREQNLFHFRSLDRTLMSVVGTLLFSRQADYWMPLLEDGLQEVEMMIEDLTDFILSGLHYTVK